MDCLCFGEVLWDVFGDKKTLGGAPLNVAGHFSRLGGNASIVSCVGDDELGRLTLAAMDDLGIDRRFVHVDPSCVTGRALVTLADGIPSYRFDDPSAWDRIELTDEEKDGICSKAWDVFVFGTLAQRNSVSRNTLCYLLDNVDAGTVFFDVNLRLDFYNAEIIRHGIEKAGILKMNDEEVPVVCELLGVESDNPVSTLIDLYSLKAVLVTRGKAGSDIYFDGRMHHQSSRKVKVVDTVGAGDSLSSGFLYFLTKGDEVPVALEKASMLADYVVQHSGAIPCYDEEIRRQLGI